MNALTIPFSVQSECQPNTDAVADAQAGMVDVRRVWVGEGGEEVG